METGRGWHGPFHQSELFLLDGDHFAAFVVAAVGADGVGQPHLAAVAARDQIAGLQGIVRAPAISAAF